MAKVKFSKQYIHPNPLEVDYWVDLDENPYGAVIKYYNGEDWIQLNGSGGSASDFDFYTKSQINKMLANKADVKDVESKVDDSELAEVIKNIQVRKNHIGVCLKNDTLAVLHTRSCGAINIDILCLVNLVLQALLFCPLYDVGTDSILLV